MIVGIGERLKALRHVHGLTLDALAARSGVSRSMISKVERGEADPTVGVLSRLAEGLGVGISALIGGYSAEAARVIRRDEQPTFVDPDTGFQRRSLSPVVAGRGVDFVLNVLPPGQAAGPFSPHPVGVEEHLAVEEGVLHVRVGAQEYGLEAGDVLFFHADAEHAFRNPGDRPCRYYIVIDASRLR